MHGNLIDMGVSVSGFVTDILNKSAIPGLSFGSYIVKRGLETYGANQYIKNEGIKTLVVFKQLCKNMELLISRQPKTEELNYVFKNYKEVYKNLDDILLTLNESIYGDVLRKEYNLYPSSGIKKSDGSVTGLIKLELIPAIVNFIQTELKGPGLVIFNQFVESQLSAFDNEKTHDIWVTTWQNSGLPLLYDRYTEFMNAQLKGKIHNDIFKKNLESWQLYMDTLSSFTQIEDIYMFLINYKYTKPKHKPFNIITFSKKYMLDPVKMENNIRTTLINLDIYIDSILTIVKVNEISSIGGGKKTRTLRKSRQVSK